MNKNITTSLTFIVPLAVIITLTAFFSQTARPFPRSSTTHPSYPADYSNNHILLGASHNVFIGKVFAQVSTNNFIGHPATQFRVEVIENIKGNLKDIVIINQEGGERDGTLYRIEGSGGMLQIGSTYLLSTRYDSVGNYYTLNPHHNASKLLSADAALDKKALKTLVDKDEKVKVLEAAYPEEQLLDADIAHANTRNAFQSLPLEAKAAAVARADAARASLGANAE